MKHYMHLNKEPFEKIKNGTKTIASFGDIYARWNKIALGYNEEDVAKPEDMEQYYPREEIEENGVVAIELKVIK